jgi:hypothetical protein
MESCPPPSEVPPVHAAVPPLRRGDLRGAHFLSSTYTAPCPPSSSRAVANAATCSLPGPCDSHAAISPRRTAIPPGECLPLPWMTSRARSPRERIVRRNSSRCARASETPIPCRSMRPSIGVSPRRRRRSAETGRSTRRPSTCVPSSATSKRPLSSTSSRRCSRTASSSLRAASTARRAVRSAATVCEGPFAARPRERSSGVTPAMSLCIRSASSSARPTSGVAGFRGGGAGGGFFDSAAFFSSSAFIDRSASNGPPWSFLFFMVPAPGRASWRAAP